MLDFTVSIIKSRPGLPIEDRIGGAGFRVSVSTNLLSDPHGRKIVRERLLRDFEDALDRLYLRMDD